MIPGRRAVPARARGGDTANARHRFVSMGEAMASVPVASAALGAVAGLPAARLVASHFALMTRHTAQVLVAGKYPVSSYPGVMRFIFTFVVPVAFMTTVPAETLLGQVKPVWLLGAAAFAATLFIGSRMFWKFALRFYTSASS